MQTFRRAFSSPSSLFAIRLMMTGETWKKEEKKKKKKKLMQQSSLTFIRRIFLFTRVYVGVIFLVFGGRSGSYLFHLNLRVFFHSLGPQILCPRVSFTKYAELTRLTGNVTIRCKWGEISGKVNNFFFFFPLVLLFYAISTFLSTHSGANKM